MARKTKAQALETRQHLLDVAITLFSQHGVSATSLTDIAKAAGVTRGAIYWHFKNKSELFNEIWTLTESSIGDLEIEYQAKYPDDPLSVVRELLIYILQATVSEERRRLMTEIIFHKCEFVGELAVMREARRALYLEGNERIIASLQRCIDAGYLPVNLNLSYAVITMRSYITGLIENWLVAPDSFDLYKNADDYVAILLEMFLFCPTLRQAKKSDELQT
ncbi:multidrug efflux transporter transcriptional repressor AcrR [uncultured Cedecea sp.]|uniref:multidrug efflux transporter transcriptional repressor AcrR n=1 Tax=uncultured Cedecea sp. TaxID=988762 RepID=UPI00260B473F|nr:multidrug efflux transporter transcriptional repressor AcrR [uncultured Cedecea sp.]